MDENINWIVVLQTAILVPLIFMVVRNVLIPALREIFLGVAIPEEMREAVRAVSIHTLAGCKSCAHSARMIQLNGNPAVRVRVCDKHAEPHRRKRLLSRIERENTIH